MVEERNANLLGALAVAVTDVLSNTLGEPPVMAASELATLVTVANYPGQPIESLRATLRLTHSGAVRVVDRLQRAGLLARTPTSRGRSVALTVTPPGRVEVTRILARRLTALTQALRALDPVERQTLALLLEKLLAALTDDRVSGRRICRLCDEQTCETEAGCPVDLAARRRESEVSPP